MNQVDYMQRSRDYYEAQGYTRPYQWASFESVPFTPLRRPLSESTVTLITTAMPDESFTRITRRLQVCDMEKPPESLYTAELFWDKEATHTRDLGSYFPIRMLAEMASERRLGRLAKHYFCVPTNYSQRATLEQD
jgi:D-proline reductase (dithiol) PrdB